MHKVRILLVRILTLASHYRRGLQKIYYRVQQMEIWVEHRKLLHFIFIFKSLCGLLTKPSSSTTVRIIHRVHILDRKCSLQSRSDQWAFCCYSQRKLWNLHTQIQLEWHTSSVDASNRHVVELVKGSGGKVCVCECEVGWRDESQVSWPGHGCVHTCGFGLDHLWHTAGPVALSGVRCHGDGVWGVGQQISNDHFLPTQTEREREKKWEKKRERDWLPSFCIAFYSCTSRQGKERARLTCLSLEFSTRFKRKMYL